MLSLGLCLNYYLVFAYACKVCNHKSRRCTSIYPPTDTYRHNTYYLAEYGERNLTIWRQGGSDQGDPPLAFISSVPRLIFVIGLGNLLLLSYPVYFACLLPFCCLNQKPLNTDLSVFATPSLSRVTCHSLLLLVGFDTLI